MNRPPLRAAWEPLLIERFYARGAHLVPNGAVDWGLDAARYVPESGRRRVRFTRAQLMTALGALHSEIGARVG